MLERARQPKATHDGAGVGIPYVVLDAGLRVITRDGLFKSIGRSWKAKRVQELGSYQPPEFLDAKNMQPFVDGAFAVPTAPFKYRNKAEVVDMVGKNEGPTLEQIRNSPRLQKALLLALEWAAELYVQDKEAEEKAGDRAQAEEAK